MRGFPFWVIVGMNDAWQPCGARACAEAVSDFMNVIDHECFADDHLRFDVRKDEVLPNRQPLWEEKRSTYMKNAAFTLRATRSQWAIDLAAILIEDGHCSDGLVRADDLLGIGIDMLSVSTADIEVIKDWSWRRSFKRPEFYKQEVTALFSRFEFPQVLFANLERGRMSPSLFFCET
ncbi:MAG TPA: hypothetical protein VHE55_11855 [Fimbriimonadaceae bacterium]|nr:hypothetical protein [Fimbriimonadaceae bacterium]